jgi:hypothetical protein
MISQPLCDYFTTFSEAKTPFTEEVNASSFSALLSKRHVEHFLHWQIGDSLKLHKLIISLAKESAHYFAEEETLSATHILRPPQVGFLSLVVQEGS